jgi:hypothetical protein
MIVSVVRQVAFPRLAIRLARRAVLGHSRLKTRESGWIVDVIACSILITWAGTCVMIVLEEATVSSG